MEKKIILLFKYTYFVCERDILIKTGSMLKVMLILNEICIFRKSSSVL